MRVRLGSFKVVVLDRAERLLHRLPSPTLVAHKVSPPIVILPAPIQIHAKVQDRAATQPLASCVSNLPAIERRFRLRDVAVIEVRAQSYRYEAVKGSMQVIAFRRAAGFEEKNRGFGASMRETVC